jgi:AraC-like DNA-binding protein
LRQIQVLAAVPASRLHRLQLLEPERYEFLGVTTWPELFQVIRSRPVALAVVDPMLSGKPQTREIESIRIQFPSLPVVLYTTLVPEMAGILLVLGRTGIRRAIFARIDDDPATLRTVVRDELEYSPLLQMIDAFAEALDGLTERVRAVLEAALSEPSADLTVDQLARQAGVNRRTFDRWFARSGLPSPRVVLMLARLLYAHRLLLDPGYTIGDVALKLGYGKARTLQQHFKEVFGVPAGELRISRSPEEAMQGVVLRYFPHQQRAAS